MNDGNNRTLLLLMLLLLSSTSSYYIPTLYNIYIFFLIPVLDGYFVFFICIVSRSFVLLVVNACIIMFKKSVYLRNVLFQPTVGRCKQCWVSNKDVLHTKPVNVQRKKIQQLTYFFFLNSIVRIIDKYLRCMRVCASPGIVFSHLKFI